jgi:putative transposase
MPRPTHPYVPTWAGFIYLAIVLDVWSRRIVGWAIAKQMTSDLVLAALNMAIVQRRPRDVIHYSDQGSQGEFNRSSQHIQ